MQLLKSYPQFLVISIEVIKLRYFLYLLFFILGACIISFLKVIAYDYPQISLTRRSHCDYCGRILRWFEIIPIIGYFIVHGRCSTCKNQLSFLYPFWEFIGGTFLVTLLYWQDLNYLPFFMMLIILSFSDYYYGYIYPIFYLIALPTIFLNHSSLHLLVGISIYLLLRLLNYFYLLGLGDIEVLAIIGFLLGLSIFLKVLLLACLFCIGIFLINKKRSFRFIPYITIATGIIYLISHFIV
ncbi:prepilin peptidase [Companilactobacillus musae]